LVFIYIGYNIGQKIKVRSQGRVKSGIEFKSVILALCAFLLFFGFYEYPLLIASMVILIDSYFDYMKRKVGVIGFIIILILVVFNLSFSEERRDWLSLIIIFIFFSIFMSHKKIPLLKFFSYGAAGFLLMAFLAIAMRTDGVLNPKLVFERVSIGTFVKTIEIETDFSIVYDDLLILYTELNEGNLDYLNGETMAKPLIAFVPRSIWEEKPETVSRRFPKEINPSFYERGGSEPLTIFGEFFWNFGYFSSIAFVFVGVYLGWIDKVFRVGFVSSDRKLVCLSLALSAYLFHLLRGPFDTFWIFHLLVFLFVFIFYRVRVSSNYSR
jgi:oligosaccharide repeat unit polymerase